MYCSKCGCRIHAGENVCSNCRTVLNDTEYCGGFWGLVGRNIPEDKAVTVETIPDPDMTGTEKADISEADYSDSEPKTDTAISGTTPDSNEGTIPAPKATKKDNNRMLLLGLCVCTVFFMLLSIVQSIRLTSYKAKYMAMANENESILKNDFDGIRNELDELKRYLAKIEEENKQKEMDSEETTQPIVDTESAQQSGESQPTEEAEDSENLEENDNSENIDEEYQEAEEMEIREGE